MNEYRAEVTEPRAEMQFLFSSDTRFVSLRPLAIYKGRGKPGAPLNASVADSPRNSNRTIGSNYFPTFRGANESKGL